MAAPVAAPRSVLGPVLAQPAQSATDTSETKKGCFAFMIPHSCRLGFVVPEALGKFVRPGEEPIRWTAVPRHR